MRHLRSLTAILLPMALLLATPMTAPAISAQALPPGDDARVTRVVSGDTIEVVIKGIGFTIAYLGMDAPDLATARAKADCYSAQALAANRKLVVGQNVRVERDVSDFDATGRLWRYVYLPDGRMVNEELLKEGYGRLSAVTPDRRYQQRLAAAEQVAQTAKKGLWGVCAPKLPAPAVARATGPCVVLDYAALAERGPRPPALDGLPEGACVTITLNGQQGNFIWKPAGSRMRLEQNLYVRWQDAFVPLTLGQDNKWRALVCVSTEWAYSNTVRIPERAYEDRELERAGAASEMVALPIYRTFLLQDVGNGDYVNLVDAFLWASGTFIRWTPGFLDQRGRC